MKPALSVPSFFRGSICDLTRCSDRPHLSVYRFVRPKISAYTIISMENVSIVTQMRYSIFQLGSTPVSESPKAAAVRNPVLGFNLTCPLAAGSRRPVLYLNRSHYCNLIVCHTARVFLPFVFEWSEKRFSSPNIRPGTFSIYICIYI